MDRKAEQSAVRLKHITYYMALSGVLLTALPANAADPLLPTGKDIQVPLIEWDLPSMADAQPGAMVVDTQGHDQNRVWFVTRLGAPQRVFKFEPSKSLMKGSARWTSWTLSETGGSGFSGGLKKIRPSQDRRFVFVRVQNSLQRIDTQNCDSGYPKTCGRTVWLDQTPVLPSVSDVATDDQNNVYTATAPTDLAADSYLQKLVPGSGLAGSYTVRRWNVGGSAGLCSLDVTSAPCASGIAVHPTNRNLVYYSEPSANNIGELDVTTNQVRRWSLAMLGGDVTEPRQLHIDRAGQIWVVTGSGHLVSLDPCTNRMTKHEIPSSNANDPFGVAPDDDVVGYTATNLAKVGMLHPKGNAVTVCPTTVCIPPTTECVTAVAERAEVASDVVAPRRKVVHGVVTSKSDGTFVEAFIGGPDSIGPLTNPAPGNDSMMPLGITPVRAKAEGTFFYAVGQSADVLVDRIGFVRLQPREKMKHGRDDDDCDDGWDDGRNHDGPDGHHGHPHHSHDADANDNDDDGFDNDYDTPAHENVQVIEDTPAIGGGQMAEYPVTTTATSLALIATSKADDPLAQIGIEVYNPAGLLVAMSAPTPGVAVAPVLLPAAGSYRVRIRNFGVLPITQTPKLIVREPWEP